MKRLVLPLALALIGCVSDLYLPDTDAHANDAQQPDGAQADVELDARTDDASDASDAGASADTKPSDASFDGDARDTGLCIAHGVKCDLEAGSTPCCNPDSCQFANMVWQCL